MRNHASRLAIAALLACLQSSLLHATVETPVAASSENSSSPELSAAPTPAATSSVSPAPAEPTQTSTQCPPVDKKPISPSAPGMDEFGRLLGYITLLAALAGAAVYLIKFGIPLHRNRSKEERKLQVLEMRPLGNRQFLVVVGYEETRMLLGVTPGKIDYLCALDAPATHDRDFSHLVEEAEKKGA